MRTNVKNWTVFKQHNYARVVFHTARPGLFNLQAIINTLHPFECQEVCWDSSLLYYSLRHTSLSTRYRPPANLGKQTDSKLHVTVPKRKNYIHALPSKTSQNKSVMFCKSLGSCLFLLRRSVKTYKNQQPFQKLHSNWNLTLPPGYCATVGQSAAEFHISTMRLVS